MPILFIPKVQQNCLMSLMSDHFEKVDPFWCSSHEKKSKFCLCETFCPCSLRFFGPISAVDEPVGTNFCLARRAVGGHVTSLSAPAFATRVSTVTTFGYLKRRSW